MERSFEIEIDYVVPGMKLFKDIYTEDGKVLVSAGTVLNKMIIDRMKNWNLQQVSIEREVELPTSLVDAKNMKFAVSYTKTVSLMRDVVEEVRATKKVPMREITEASEDLTEQVITTGMMIDQLYPLPNNEDWANYHATNVGVIATLIGMWKRYPDEIINMLTLAAMLHDIGKACIDPELLKKQDRTPAEQAEYERHCFHGEMLLANGQVSESISQAVFQHHEREDGSGFTLHLTGKDIHPFAKIIAVADMFDNAMLNRFAARRSVSPYQGVEVIRSSIYCLDPTIVLTFCGHMLDYLSGNIVQLTDGRRGRVVYVNRQQPSKSMVQLADGTVLDLEEQDAGIQCVVPDAKQIE